MHRILLMLCAALTGFAQQTAPPVEKVTSDKAPKAVDDALRARVNQFYQAHVDGKYRIADQVVAEESKDLFFAAPKPKYDGFEIVRINYYENFTKADAVVACKTKWNVHGQMMPVSMPITTNWKIIDGQWFWYVVPTDQLDTPFGTMHFDAASKNPNASSGNPMPGDPAALARQILLQVQTDKTELMLSSYEPSSGEVKIKNGMGGRVTLSVDVDGMFPGLSFQLDKKEVNAGESATLSFKCVPKDKVAKPTLTARITVDPINLIIPVKLMFAIPPEIEKLIPKDARPKQ